MKTADIKRKLKSKEFFLKNNPKDNIKSGVWKIFKLVLKIEDEQEVSTDHVFCTRCSDYSLLYKTSSGTTGMRRHLERCGESQAMKQIKTSINASANKKMKGQNFSQVGVHGDGTQVSVEFNKGIVETMIKNFCMEDLQPFHVVEGKGFRELAQTFVRIGSLHGHINITDAIPSSSTLSRDITKAYNGIMINLKKEFQYLQRKCPFGISFSGSVWVTENVRYFGVQAHYMSESFDIVDRILQLYPFPTSSENEEDVEEELMKHLNYTFLLVGMHDTKDKKTVIAPPNLLQFSPNNAYFSSYPCLPSYINTVCLQTYKHADFPPVCKKAIVACTTLVDYVIQADLNDQLVPCLQQEDESDWMSLLACLESVKANKHTLYKLLEDKNNLEYYHSIQWEVIDEVTTFMEPIGEIVTFFQTPRVPTFPFSILCYELLLKKMATPFLSESSRTKKMRTLFKEHMEEKFENVFGSFEYKLAEFFIPYLKEKRLRTEKEKNELKTHLIQQCRDINIDDFMQGGSNGDVKDILWDADTKDLTASAKKKRKKSHFAFDEVMTGIIGLNPSASQQSKTSSVEAEFELYCSESMDYMNFFDEEEDEDRKPFLGNVLEWWKFNQMRYPRLSVFAKYYLSLPVSSNGLEREFALSDNKEVLQRTSVDSIKLNKLVVCRSNSDLSAVILNA